jgi:hypothetical protein
MLYDEPTVGLIAQSVLAGVVSRQIYLDDGEHLGTEMATGDGSWAVVHHTRDGDREYRVIQAGPRRLWDEIEALHREWVTHDRPAHDRFGLTVTSDGRHRVWLDNPDSDRAWELPTR